jgi:glutamine phosphoribosylpyrophosphate amidotransferase
MCGIAGILQKSNLQTSEAELPAPVGRSLLNMAACLQHRGMDSAGMAVFGAADTGLHLQVMMPTGMLSEPQEVLRLGDGRLSGLCPEGAGFSAGVLPAAGNAVLADSALVQALEAGLPGATVSGMGRRMVVKKAVGLAEGLEGPVGALVGTHGIAHLRLATESRIDPAHAQPFWGRPYPDIAVTHNGHITNYHKMRQRFEAEGFAFASHNDSEIIGIYLGRKLAAGLTLQEALLAAGQELDGSYSCIVATANGLGVVRDPFATKPLLFVETETQVALASEPQGLYRLLGQNAVIKEIRPREVRVWERA